MMLPGPPLMSVIGTVGQIPTVPAAPTTTVPDPAAVAAAVAAKADALANACGADPSWVCRQTFERTGGSTWGGVVEFFVAKPLTILTIVLVAIVANRILRRVIRRTTERMLNPQSTRSQRARDALRSATPNLLLKTGEVNLRTEARVLTLTTVFRSLSTVFVWLIAFFAILNALGLDLRPLLASAGIIGVALGFGAQNVVRDFLAGIFLVMEDQFGVGDIVDIGEAKGTVEEITLRATGVRDVNGTLWHVPNGQIQRVANKSQEWARAVLDLEVGIDTDYERAATVIKQVADTLAGERDWRFDILGQPEVWGIEAFTTFGYTIRLVIKTRPASQFGVMRELRIRLRAAFTEHQIHLPNERPEIWVHESRSNRSVRAPRPDGWRGDQRSASGEVPVVTGDPVVTPGTVTTTSPSGLEIIGGAVTGETPVAGDGPETGEVPPDSDARRGPKTHPTRGDPSEG